MHQTIETLCREYRILYAEIWDTDSAARRTYGNRAHLPYQGLYRSLSGDAEQTDRLRQMLQNGFQPYLTWRQGNMVALCFLRQKQLFCLFYCSETRGIESLSYARAVYDAFILLSG